MTRVEIDKYRKALVEVEAVLNCLEEDAYKKIPNDILQAIEENKNEYYEFDYDEDLDYNQWNLSSEAIALLYNIYKRYIASEEEQRYFQDKERFETKQLERQKSIKYNSNNIFKNTNLTKETNNQNEEHKELVKIPEEKWYIKLFNVIKHIFKIK